MKTFLILIMTAVSIVGRSQTSLHIIGEGTKLEYEVKENGMRYTLVVTIRQFKDYGDKDMIFDWQLSGSKNEKGQLVIPKENLSYSSILLIQPSSWTRRLERKEMAIVFPSSCQPFTDAESSLDVNDITFTMEHKRSSSRTMDIPYNNEARNFPFWEIESTGSYPDTDYTFWLSAIQGKLDDKDDVQGGSPYKLVHFIYAVSMKGFEMKMVKITN